MAKLDGTYEVQLDVPIVGPPNGMAATRSLPGESSEGVVAAEDPRGVSVERSLAKLGLALTSRRLITKTLVVDQLEKIPTDN